MKFWEKYVANKVFFIFATIIGFFVIAYFICDYLDYRLIQNDRYETYTTTIDSSIHMESVNKIIKFPDVIEIPPTFWVNTSAYDIFSYVEISIASMNKQKRSKTSVDSLFDNSQDITDVKIYYRTKDEAFSEDKVLVTSVTEGQNIFEIIPGAYAELQFSFFAGPNESFELEYIKISNSIDKPFDKEIVVYLIMAWTFWLALCWIICFWNVYCNTVYPIMAVLFKFKEAENVKQKSAIGMLLLLLDIILFGIYLVNVNSILSSVYIAFYAFIIFLIGVLVLVMYCFIFLYDNFAKRFAVILFLAGFVCVFAYTPFSMPDEAYHFFQSVGFSNLITFNQDDYKNIEGSTAYIDYSMGFQYGLYKPAYADLVTPLFNGNDDVYENVSLERGIGKEGIGARDIIEYFPQTIGVTLGKLLNLSPVWVFYLGRICNLIIYVILASLAVKIAPESYKYIFMILTLMPGCLESAASYSPDVYVNTLAFLLVAKILQQVHNEKSYFKLKDCIIIIALSVLLVQKKYIYSLIALLIFIVPKERFKNKRDYWIKCFSAVGCIAFSLFWDLNLFSFIGGSLGSAGTVSANGVTLSYIVSHIPDYIRGLLNTVIASEFYLTHFVGMYLKTFFNYSYFFCILLCVFANAENKQTLMNAGRRVYIIIISITIYALVLTSMLIAWPPSNIDLIQGVQGRYFIPIAITVMAACNSNILGVNCSINKLLVFAAVIINALALNSMVSGVIGI